MGTKNNPGQFDCHAKAEDDEPMFTLLARDPAAPHLVNLWAAVEEGDLIGIAEAVRALKDQSRENAFTMLGRNFDKYQEAKRCAEDMTAWRKRNRPL